MKILAIDTSADETSVAVTSDLTVLSNVVWSQASLHAKWGGVVPSLAQRAHSERIDWVIKKALGNRHKALKGIDAVAVTVGPGLAIALGVGVEKARKISEKFKIPLIAINHIEGHILSPLARPKTKNNIELSLISFPAFGLVISGKNTILTSVEKLGKYKVLAQTRDDALGEALDKSGRMLGLGYPAGPIVEKMAKEGNPKVYPLPIPVIGREKEHFFTYSGLKTAMFKLVEKIKLEKKILTKEDIQNLCASFQSSAFTHLVRVTRQTILDSAVYEVKDLLVGGGVCANVEARKRLGAMGKNLNLKLHFPYSKKLCGDNAAMIGVAAYFKAIGGEFINPVKVDRLPQLKIDQEI